MAGYDTYYKTENYFGDAYACLTDFFSALPTKGTLLDMGCGQGRDALPLARMGFHVTGVDTSRVGIAQMTEQAKQEALPLVGVVGDMYAWESYASFNIVLFDSMFHFEKRERKKEKALLTRVLHEMSPSSLLALFIYDVGSKMATAQETLAEANIPYEEVYVNRFTYAFEDDASSHTSGTPFIAYVIRKS